jgi:hypothetical protein
MGSVPTPNPAEMVYCFLITAVSVGAWSLTSAKILAFSLQEPRQALLVGKSYVCYY